MCACTYRSVHPCIQLACYCKTRVYFEIKVAPKTLTRSDLLLKQWFSADDFFDSKLEEIVLLYPAKRIFFF